MTGLPSIKMLPITGLRLIKLDIRSDSRGWFAETWQSAKFAELGLSNFTPIQSNVSSNEEIGTTRGLHAEPWNKLVTITSGSAFAAWVDLRKGDDFGKVVFLDLTPGMSVFIPAGVANGFQTTSTNTTYSYLVDGHWSAGIAYQTVHAFDSDLAIPWPLPFSKSTMSSKDSSLESLSQCSAVADRSVILLGSRGQVGKALLKQFPDAITPSRNELMEAFDRGALEDLVPTGGIILNAAAMTNVDECETIEGYKEAIRVNYHLVQRLAEAANSKHATLVHFSTDYVFDGKKDSPYTETDLPNPINNYGMSKLLGDMGAQTAKRHYIFRTSWLYGDGKNFVRTMAGKAALRESVGVVSNQIGLPTRADSLALAVSRHLHLATPFGLYNFTDSGDTSSWHKIAVAVYEELLVDPIKVADTGEGNWVSSDPPVARRPNNSMLSQDKTNREAGQVSQNWKMEIKEYLAFSD